VAGCDREGKVRNIRTNIGISDGRQLLLGFEEFWENEGLVSGRLGRRKSECFWKGGARDIPA